MRRLTVLVVANRRVAAGVVIGVVAVLASVFGYFAWGSRQEANASDLLFRAASQLAVSRGSAEDLNKDEEAVQLLREVTTRYPRTAAAAEATLRLGNRFYTLENYDEARAVYQSYLSKNPKGLIAFSAGIGIGDTYLAERKYDKAVESYLWIINRFPQDPLLPEAYLNLARTYLSVNKAQDAARIYEKIGQTHPNTGWGQNAQVQLRKLRLAQ